MKSLITAAATALFLSHVLAHPSIARRDGLTPTKDLYSSWAAPGPDDSNHHFLPHDGGALTPLTEEIVVAALHEGLNFNESLGKIMFEQALPANPGANATFFTLDMLNRHNVLEHDASLSRSDAYFGNNHIFNQTIFDETRKYWTGDVLDREMLSKGKLARMLQSRATNPEYTFTETVEHFSIGETLAPVIVFGDRESVTVNKTLVEYFFENERLPVELGWTKQEKVVSLEDILRLLEIFAESSSLFTVDANSTTASTVAKRGDLHTGM